MNSLRRRLTFTHTSVALLAVLLMALLSGGLLVRAYLEIARQQARSTAQRISVVLVPLYQRNQGWDGADVILEQRFAEGMITRRVVIIDANQQVVFDNLNMLPDGVPLPQRLRATAAVEPIVLRRPLRGNATVGYVVVPSGLFAVDVAERGLFENLTRIGVLGSCASGLAAVVVALLVVRHVTAPLRSMTRAAQRLASGERHEPLPIPQDRELAELAASFNTMAAELERQEGLRRQLVADIAHELRTPLSVLRLQIESIEDGIEQPTPDVFASLAHEVNLLTRLVNDLRFLSLADAGQLSLRLEPVDGRELLERVAASVQPRARQQQVDLRVEPCRADLPPVLADRERLAQVLGNLVENALRYTPSGGQVRLSIRDNRPLPALPPHTGSGRLWCITPPTAGNATDPSEVIHVPRREVAPPPMPDTLVADQWVAFAVSDTGPGIAPADLPHIFDRFYRTDRARARETGGSGLGLAIVQRLVEAQGGRVEVVSAVGKGTTFHVYLPVVGAVPVVPTPA